MSSKRSGPLCDTYKADVMRATLRFLFLITVEAELELRSVPLSGRFAEKAPLWQLFDANSPTNGRERMIDTSKPEGK